MINLKATNEAQVIAELTKLGVDFDKGTGEAADEILMRMKEAVQSRLWKPKHGVLSGHMRASYQQAVEHLAKGSWLIKFWTEVEYDPYVEFNYGGRLAHFWPGVFETEEKIPDIWQSKLGLK